MRKQGNHRKCSGCFFDVLCGKRAKSGSISVFFALLLGVIVPLILAEITSVKVSADRTQAANVADQCMDSLFAHYDRETADLFDLFFLYAGGTADAGASSCIRFLEEYTDEMFSPGGLKKAVYGSPLLDLQREETGLGGYVLATDASGTLFREEAAEAMKETAGAGVLAEIRQKMHGTGTAATQRSGLFKESGKPDFTEVERAAREAAKEKAETGEGSLSDPGDHEETDAAEVPDDFVNPLPAVISICGKPLLDLVVPDGRKVSASSVSREMLVSGRTLSSGTGVIDASETGGSSGAFRAWVFTHFGNFTEPSEYSKLSLQTEYILSGKKSDRENLQKIVKRLLLVRESANIACLYTDASKSAELETAALFTASLLMIPEATELVRAVLAAGWAYAESVVDVRALLEGKKVPVVKNGSDWQTDLEALAKCGGDIGSMTKDSAHGVSYGDYLGLFLITADLRSLTMRAMDMTEMELQGRGRPDFRLDACMVSVTASVTVRAEHLVSFRVERTWSYLGGTK